MSLIGGKYEKDFFLPTKVLFNPDFSEMYFEYIHKKNQIQMETEEFLKEDKSTTRSKIQISKPVRDNFPWKYSFGESYLPLELRRRTGLILLGIRLNLRCT
ncbi:hypothetical protein A0128_11720 [Leptospira tipperaryensis]|uniref:Uncharacterized protein n=1 Tax=Leptospira tipperaryensis TaxID=2564040 RepID=A0A1D7UXZ6_9LEPT|nr:hypothetical protein [Leptospira tipperaryensis]AOP34457.1 hypothetical protein A0128_11720 [Leptospira tipperaryensis]